MAAPAPLAVVASPSVAGDSSRRLGQLSLTLSLYLGKQVMLGVGIAFVGLAVIALTIDFIELTRRASDQPDATLGTVAFMAWLHLPFLMQKLMPFVVLFGTMLTFLRLTRTHELIAARTVGVSVWQFLLPALLLSLGLGAFIVVAFNPLAAAMVARYENLDQTVLSNRSSLLSIAPGGLWFRQTETDRELVLHARQIAEDSDDGLRHVVVFVFRGDGQFFARADAPTARLVPDHWELQNALLTKADGSRSTHQRLLVETDLTPGRINESLATPETLSFWDLQGFIHSLEDVGLSARQHKMYLHSLVALPLLLSAMLLIGTTTSLRLVRRGGTGLLVMVGLVTGFAFYVLSDIVFAIGLSGRLPPVMAAWIPAGAAVLLGVTTLLHIEDG